MELNKQFSFSSLVIYNEKCNSVKFCTEKLLFLSKCSLYRNVFEPGIATLLI